MKKSKGIVSKELVLEMISQEKEAYSQYERLCRRFQIDPDPIAVRTFQAKMEILDAFLNGETTLAYMKTNL